MKKIFLSLVILCKALCCISQTKAETTNWIISKFNKWQIVDNRPEYSNGVMIGGTSEKPISTTFSNCTMVIKTNFRNFRTSGSYDLNTYSINIADIGDIVWSYSNRSDYYYLIITTVKSTVKKTSVTKSKYSYNEKKSSEFNEEYFDKCIIAFNTNGEEDFKSRMLQAFSHLRTFCKSAKKEKEAF